MRTITSFSDVSTALQDFIPPSDHKPYTLDNITALMSFLGNPQNRLAVIHVAGTSGKTSTAYYLAALLHATGRNVGLSVSPHIDSVAERAQINMESLDEAEYCKELSAFLRLVDESGIKVSYFEVLVAFMYWLFERKGVDYAVVEVGLGGLLDGTNVISSTNKICVITDIGLDHIEVLGKTLPEIAAQKAGIIFPGNEVFMNLQGDEVIPVFQKSCTDKGATLHIVDKLTSEYHSLPSFQRRNFGLAYETIRHILPSENDRSDLEDHLSDILDTYIPARMEETTWKDKTLILDGSHNEQKLSALVSAMKEKYHDIELTLLVSFGQNKSSSLEANLRMLRNLTDSIIITQFAAGQDEIRKPLDPSVIAHAAKTQGFTAISIEPNPIIALDQATARSANIILVTGSFYLLNHIRPLVFKTSA